MSGGGHSGYLNAVYTRSAVPSTSHCIAVSAVSSLSSAVSASSAAGYLNAVYTCSAVPSASHSIAVSAVPVSAVSISSVSSAISMSPGASTTSLSLFNEVYASGVPNHKGCRIAIPHSKLNISIWREKLVGYSDYIICDLLEFGFPLDYRGKNLDFSSRRNHKGARDHAAYVSKYLERECGLGRMAGPFVADPFPVPMMVSPINTVPKDDPTERRVIVDLSWPPGRSINFGISKDVYLDLLIDLKYASVEEVCQMVMEVGRGAHIYKRDLRHAYRQLPIDPGDYRYLGYYWEGYFYHDLVLVMGQRNAGMACTRTTDAVVHIHKSDGYRATNYLDDLIGVAPPASAQIEYQELGLLLHDLGLEENMPKACPPATSQTVLGVVIDTVALTISVTSDRLREIKDMVAVWLRKKTTTKSDLRSLCGKLLYCVKCVRQSRTFLNRALEVFQSFPRGKRVVRLTDSFRKDILWWSRFVKPFNGVSFIPPLTWEEPDAVFSTDSTLNGCGGISGGEFFHSGFPAFIAEQELPIHALELLTVIVAVRLWGDRCQGMNVVVYCDNDAAVHVINSGRSRDAFMAACIRELWLVVATNLFQLRAVHLPGVENRLADALSRWDESVCHRNLFYSFISDSTTEYCDVHVDDSLFTFSDI